MGVQVPTADTDVVSHYIYYEVKSPLDLLVKVGWVNGKLLIGKEDKVMRNGLLQ
jgi:hypothetical protein